MQKNISSSINHLGKENSFSFNNYLFNIRDTVFSMVIDILAPDEQNSKTMHKTKKMKTPQETKRIYNNKILSEKLKNQFNQNKTYNRNENKNKLYNFFIKKDNKESICKNKKSKIYNINTMDHTLLKKKNYLKINIDTNKDDNLNNYRMKQTLYNGNNKSFKNNFCPKTKSNKIINTSLISNKNIYNIKTSQKIHFYVTNIIDNIPNFKKKKNNVIKKENIDNNKNNNHDSNKEIIYNNDNYYKIHKTEQLNNHILNKNRKNNSQHYLYKKNAKFSNNRTIFKNYISSIQNYSKSINIDKHSKNSKNISQNSYFYINDGQSTERVSQNISFDKSKIKKIHFQKILFDISNIKFKHLLIVYLDQKSIANLSFINKIFYKNFRNIFFSNISKKLLSERRDIYIKKIIRSVFKYSSFKLNNKIEFKLFYESMKRPNKKYNSIINNDLLRTFPDDINFKEGNKYYHKLSNLLTCYSNYNNNIGYAQGLNFLFGSAIYFFSSEEDIFLFIDGFINFLKLENFLGINNQNNLPEKINYISHILEKYIPDIISVFNKKFVKIEIFLTNWILTLFSSSMKRKNLIIIWCFMILFGWKFFYCLIIQILIQYQDNIFILNEVELCNKMKKIFISNEFNQHFDNIINKAIIFMKEHIVL